MTVTPARSIAWAAISFGLFVVALFAAFPVLALARLFGETPHLAEMAAWSVIWGGASLASVLVAARMAFGAWPAVSGVAAGIAVVGIGLSAVVHVVLQQWELARFGITEPELVGPTAGLFAVLIALAVAGFAAFVGPRRLIGWPLAAVALSFLGIAIIVISNVPGLDDGIGADSVPLAIWVGLSAVYALIVTALVALRALGRFGDARP